MLIPAFSGQGRVRFLLQECPFISRLCKPRRPFPGRTSIPRIRPERSSSCLRLHLQLWRTTPSPHPRLADRHTTCLVARSSLRLQPRRPNRLRCSRRQHQQEQTPRITPTIPLHQNLTFCANGGRLPSPPSRPCHDIFHHFRRDQSPA